jgi:pSer/pThr/pTyr-binding forkhead associated (FHA) protein
MNDANRTQMLSSDPNRTQMGAPPTAGDPNRTMMGSAPSINATQTIKPTQCPVCKTFNPAGVMFCIDCGLIFDRALPDDAFGAPTIQLPVLIDESGREYPIRPGANVVGREGDILLADGRVSRRHAQINSQDGALTLEDLGSTNGSKVNGTKLASGETKALAGGDKISFGGLELQLNLPGTKRGNTTQTFAGNQTAAIPTAPRKDVAPAKLVSKDGKSYPLKVGENTFGRRSENDVQIADPYVSGRHGIVEFGESGAFIIDTGSTNGTLLNDAKLAPQMRTALSPTDVIRLGSIELQLVVE